MSKRDLSGVSDAENKHLVFVLFVLAILELFTGLLFAQYDEQFKLQKHAAMMALKSVGFGNTNLMENKIVEEMSHVIAAFRVRYILQNRQIAWDLNEY